PLRRLLQRHGAGDLERDLARVDLVVRTVDERGPDVHERVPGQHAALAGLLDTLVHGRDVLARNLPADDLVHELVAATGAGGLEIDHGVPVLASAAALAHEARVDLVDVLADRLAVRDLGLPDVRADVELAHQAIHQDLEVQL